MNQSRYEIISDENEKPKGRFQIIDDEKTGMDNNPFKNSPHKGLRETLGNEELVKEMIDSALPGAGLYAGGKEIISHLLGKAGRGIINTVKAARSNVAPVEQAAGKAISEAEQKAMGAGEQAEIATREAAEAKPGLYEKPTSELENVEHEIGKHINVEQSHDVAASSAITNRVKAIEEFWSDAYQQLEKKVADAKFNMPEQAMEHLTYDNNEIMKRLKMGANPKTVVKEIEAEKAAAQNTYYNDLMKNAPTSQDVSAKDFLAKHRDFRDALGGLKQDMKSEFLTSGEKKKIKEAINRGKEVQMKIKDALREGLGEYKSEFDWINKGYAEQVFPLRKNPLVRAAAKGKMPKNIIEALRTNESGMPLMRELVRQDPELLRNVMGQRYKMRPADIHHPDAMVREYLDEMPQFKRLIQQKEAVMKKTAARKDISLKEKVRLENELKEIKKAKEIEVANAKKLKKQAKKKLVKSGLIAGGVLGGYMGAPYVLNKTAKLFTGD